MSNGIETNEIYGRLDVSVPEAVYEAGKVSVVTILIRNSFDKAVEILEIQGPRSSHVREVGRFTNKNRNSQRSREKSNWFISLFKNLSNLSITEIKFSGIRAEFPTSDQTLNINAEPNSEVEIAANLSEYTTVNINLEKEAKLQYLAQKDDINKASTEEKKSITVEPHCEAVAYFQISTDGWLFFTPTRRSLSTLVTYAVNGKKKTQVVTSEFDVRPPLLSMVVGTISGALLGTLAKVLNAGVLSNWQDILVAIGASVVMSLIATLALSRKTGTQGFITVEDFFGGFVIGALIGYGGSSYFEKAIIPTDQENL